jgi:hypothetical protein
MTWCRLLELFFDVLFARVRDWVLAALIQQANVTLAEWVAA